MKKVLEGIKSFFSFVLFVIYFLFALVMTVLLLNFNDFGVTQFGNKSFVLINDKISNESYKKGNLVVVESLKKSYNQIEGDVKQWKTKNQF